jgi:hypothetical protein
MMLCGVFAALFEQDAARRADGRRIFLALTDYDN